MKVNLNFDLDGDDCSHEKLALNRTLNATNAYLTLYSINKDMFTENLIQLYGKSGIIKEVYENLGKDKVSEFLEELNNIFYYYLDKYSVDLDDLE